MKQREKIVPQAEGEVLEIGCGSGLNFSYYRFDKVSRLYALEPARGMVIKARKEAEKLGLTEKIEFLETGGEATGLDDNSIDTIIFAFVLCTIPDWRSTLEEARRVLRPGGRILFTEHGPAPDEGVLKWQRRVEPFWKVIAGGCHLTRNCTEMFRSSGFELRDVQTMYLPNTTRIAGFVTWGEARPA
ncbi:MAG: class I SAM-dependent methyltransferase [Hyphomonas sp.]